MKIIAESESSMEAQRSPWGQIALGAGIIAIGIFTVVGIRGHGLALILLLFLAVAAFGVFEIVSAKRVTIVADKSSGTFTVSWRSILGAGESSVAIADIDAITYRETVTTQRTSKGVRKVRKDDSTLYLKDGSSLLLDKEQTSSSASLFSFWTPSLGRSSDEVADKALAGFIGVTFYDKGAFVPPAVTGLLGQAALEDPQTPEPAEAAAAGPAVAAVGPAVAAAVGPAVATQAAPVAQVAPAPIAPTPAAPAPAAPTEAPPMQAPPTPSAAPGAPVSGPYWEPTPPPWAR